MEAIGKLAPDAVEIVRDHPERHAAAEIHQTFN